MDDVRPLVLAAFAVATTLGLLALLSAVRRGLATDLGGGNAATRLLAVGQVLSVFLVAASAVKNSVAGDDLFRDAVWVAAFGMGGLAMVLSVGGLGVRLLFGSRLPAEVARGNVAAGVAGGAHYVATGIITSHALAGNDLRTLGLSLTFFVLGQLTLHVFVSLFRALTTYDDAEQIAGENLAAALSYSGVAVAVAIIVGRAAEGEFEGWRKALTGYAGVALLSLTLYPVRQLFVQTLLLRAPIALRGGPLDEGIAVHRSYGTAALEAVTYVATALSVAHLA
jgi:uncharacterized membrane protein YjfL (UPF0719 family)